MMANDHGSNQIETIQAMLIIPVGLVDMLK